MTQYISNCVGCETCIGTGCPNRRKHREVTCDCCGAELMDNRDLYRINGKDLCIDCLIEEIGAEIIEE